MLKKASASFRQGTLIVLLCLTISLIALNAMAKTFLTPQDILKIPFTPAQQRIAYGNDAHQFGDLRIPKGSGPYPVLVVIHGGCWTSKFANLDFMSAFSEEFTKAGMATWNIEYRCVDQTGGGWPGTFLDIGKAVDHLREIAPLYQLDLDSVVIIGHSAGGHLALWTGARHALKNDSDLYSPNPLVPKAVVNIGGPGDLRGFLSLQESCCKDKVIHKLLGNFAEISEKNLAQASPFELLPFAAKQILMTGEYDEAAPVASQQAYVKRAKKLGADVESIVIKDAAHFEVIAPATDAWGTIKNRVMKLFKE
jgi:acetyl esterase/lipase